MLPIIFGASVPNWVLLGLIGVAAFGVVKILTQKDTEIETRRRNAFQISAMLRENGLAFTPSLLEDYAVGDYSGLASKIKSFASLMTSNPKMVQSELDNVLERVFEKQLQNPESVEKIKSLMVKSGKLAPDTTTSTTAKV